MRRIKTVSLQEGMVVSEDVILEVVRVGTGDPVAIGEVGEIVITSLDPRHPVIRLALGDLTAVMDTPSPCGRTNVRIRGWLGRVDRTAALQAETSHEFSDATSFGR
jgi:phenylacetate-CoA ligase